MALHLALLEPPSAPILAAIARRAAASDIPVHLVGALPEPFDPDSQQAWQAADGWVHPTWRDFRAAMARERCFYFAAPGDGLPEGTALRDAETAPIRTNSVLVIGDGEGRLPPPILTKYPARLYRLPMPPRKRKVDLASSVDLLIDVALAGLVAAGRAPATATAPMRYGRGRGRR